MDPEFAWDWWSLWNSDLEFRKEQKRTLRKLSERKSKDFRNTSRKVHVLPKLRHVR